MSTLVSSRKIALAALFGVEACFAAWGGGEALAGELELSAEIPLDAPILGPATGSQRSPSLVWDGEKYLLTWTDERPWHSGSYGVFLDAAGKILGPSEIELGDGLWWGKAYANGTYVVLATEGSGPSVTLKARMFNQALEPLGETLIKANTQINDPTVTFVDGHFFAIWREGNYPSARFAARIEVDGTLLDPGGYQLLDKTYSSASLVPGGQGFLALWPDTTFHLRGARVLFDGTLLDPGGFLVSGTSPNQLGGYGIFDGNQYIVGWSDGNAVRLARVTQGGVVLDPNGVLVLQDNNHEVVGPWFGFGGTTPFLVTGHYPGEYWLAEYRATRIDSAFASLGTTTLMTRGAGAAWSVGGPDVLFALAPSTGDDTWDSVSIATTRMDGAGTLLDVPPQWITTSANAQSQPDVAFDGANFLVTWSDARGFEKGKGWDVFAARVSQAGDVLDTVAMPLPTTYGWEMFPRAVFDGQNTLVTYWNCNIFMGDGDEWCNGKAVRVSPSGVVLDPTPIELPFEEVAYDLSSLGVSSAAGRTLVAGIYYHDLQAVFVDQDGTVSTPFLPAAGTVPIHLTAAFDGTNHLVAWSEHDKATALWTVRAARIDQNGQILDRAPIFVASAKEGDDLAAGSAGDHVVIAYNEVIGADAYVRAVRVTSAGVVLDPGGILLGKHEGCKDVELGPGAVAYDGHVTLVTWRACGPSGSDFHVAALGDNGTVALAEPLIADGLAHSAPALAQGKARTFVAYSSLRRDPPIAAERMFGRTFLSKLCATGADCPSGFCSDFVCCDTACGDGDPADCIACSVLAGAAIDGTCGVVADGHVCGALESACEEAGSCQAGQCVAGAAISCAPPHECQEAATCDPMLGCIYPSLPDGAPCGLGMQCMDGVCSPIGSVSSAASTSGGGGATSTSGVGGSPDAPNDDPMEITGSCICGVSRAADGPRTTGLAWLFVALGVALRRRLS